MIESTWVFVIESSKLDDQGCLDSTKLWEVFEKGREQWYQQIGLSLGTLYQQGLEMEIEDFMIHVRRLQAKAGQKVKLVTRPVWTQRSGYFELTQKILNEKKIELASAKFTLLVVSNMTMEMTSLPESILAAVKRSEPK